MTEKIRTELKREGQLAFPEVNTENENSAKSSTEKTDIDQTQSQEGESNSGADNKDGDIEKKDGEDEKLDNFANHPRWKEREETHKKRYNEQEVRHSENIENIRKEYEEKMSKLKEEILSEVRGNNPDKNKTEIPFWFNGDEEQWREYSKHEDERINRAVESRFSEVDKKTAEQQSLIDEATKYMHDEVNSIEKDKNLNPTGEKIDREKLWKVVDDYKLLDDKKRWNYRAAWLILRGMANKPTKDLGEKKKLANELNSENRGETKEPYVATSETFKGGNRPW